MDTTQDLLQIKWNTVKRHIRQKWGKITDDDLILIDGNTGEFINVLRRRYGYGKTQAEIEIKNWLLDLSHRKSKSN